MRSEFRHRGPFYAPAVLLQVCVFVLAGNPARAEDWPRVRVTEPVVRASVNNALDGVLQWWANSKCQTVITDFHDRQGCPLTEKLTAMQTTFDKYLQWIVIRDSSGATMCKNPNVIAHTKIGSRTVFVCGAHFRRLWERDSERAIAVMIHEVLHTLGLGENPPFPTSLEVTRIVLERCRGNSNED